MSSIKPFVGIDEIITQIYQGPLETSPWQTFLACLRVRLDCDMAVMALRRPEPGALSFILWEHRHPLDEAKIKKIVAEHTRLAHLDPLIGALRESGDIYTLDDVVDAAELATSEYYRCVLSPGGIAHQLAMYFAEPDGWKCHVAIMNGPGRRSFGAAEKDFFRAFRPHLEHALGIYAQLKCRELETKAYGETLDTLGIGTILLDGQGRVMEANQLALQILRQNSCIALTERSVVPVKPRYRDELNRLILAALAWRRAGHAGTFVDALRIESPGGDSLGVLVRAAPLSQLHRTEASPSVILYIEGPEQDAVPPEQFVARLFGMTRSEALLATLLASGFSLAEAGEKLSLTDSSVRTYSKKVFSKLGVSRQSDLVRVVMKSVALLAGGLYRNELPARR